MVELAPSPEIRAIIEARIKRLESGLYGDVESVGHGVSELRIHIGSGYRVYFTEVQGAVVLLLAGGDKSTQKTDIKLARKMINDIKAKVPATRRKP